MSTPSLYADLSHYYDILCANIDYLEHSQFLMRASKARGNAGMRYLDLGCGSGVLLNYFYDAGYSCHGLDISEQMLKLAAQRCPNAQLIRASMCDLSLDSPQDLISCFLYSIHYCQSIAEIQQTFSRVFDALSPEGLFCFDAVDKNCIANDNGQIHTVKNAVSELRFQSRWCYHGDSDPGDSSLELNRRTDEDSDQMVLHLDIRETRDEQEFHYQERHRMTAVTVATLRDLLCATGFEVMIFEHDFSRMSLWSGDTGNTIFCATKPLIT